MAIVKLHHFKLVIIIYFSRIEIAIITNILQNLCSSTHKTSKDSFRSFNSATSVADRAGVFNFHPNINISTQLGVMVKLLQQAAVITGLTTSSYEYEVKSAGWLVGLPHSEDYRSMMVTLVAVSVPVWSARV